MCIKTSFMFIWSTSYSHPVKFLTITVCIIQVCLVHITHPLCLIHLLSPDIIIYSDTYCSFLPHFTRLLKVTVEGLANS